MKLDIYNHICRAGLLIRCLDAPDISDAERERLYVTNAKRLLKLN